MYIHLIYSQPTAYFWSRFLFCTDIGLYPVWYNSRFASRKVWYDSRFAVTCQTGKKKSDPLDHAVFFCPLATVKFLSYKVFFRSLGWFTPCSQLFATVAIWLCC